MSDRDFRKIWYGRRTPEIQQKYRGSPTSPRARCPLWSNLPEYRQITPARQNSRKPLWKKVRPAHFSDRHQKGVWRDGGEAVQITSTLATPTQHTENIKKNQRVSASCFGFASRFGFSLGFGFLVSTKRSRNLARWL